MTSTAVCFLLVLFPCFVMGDITHTNHSAQPPTSSEWGPANHGFQFSVRPKKAQFVLTEPMLVDLEIRNVTDHAVGFSERGFPYTEFDVVVKDARGQMLPLTRYGKLVYHAPIPSFVYKNAVLELQPGGEAEYHFWINRVFDMTLPGTYYITIKRHVSTSQNHFDEKSGYDIVSNTSPIKVVESSEFSDNPATSLGAPLLRPKKTLP